jgi:hypothetical protein
VVVVKNNQTGIPDVHNVMAASSGIARVMATNISIKEEKQLKKAMIHDVRHIQLY